MITTPSVSLGSLPISSLWESGVKSGGKEGQPQTPKRRQRSPYWALCTASPPSGSGQDNDTFPQAIGALKPHVIDTCAMCGFEIALIDPPHRTRVLFNYFSRFHAFTLTNHIRVTWAPRGRGKGGFLWRCGVSRGQEQIKNESLSYMYRHMVPLTAPHFHLVIFRFNFQNSSSRISSIRTTIVKHLQTSYLTLSFARVLQVLRQVLRGGMFE